MADAKQQDPIIKRAKVKGTGLPIDGHTLTFGFWAYDGHKQPHSHLLKFSEQCYQ